jgi:hypothetical protein
MATMKKAQDGNFIRKGMSAVKGFKKPASKMVPGEMTGKMYRKSEIDDIGKKQAAELDKSGVFGKAAMAKKKAPKAKNGMLKRADGSYSKRGLWDNLRSKAAKNKATGAKPKAPSKAMLSQEKKIKAKGK